MSLPLSGIRIVDLTRLLPGPFCTMLLADFGADVIKVEERASGDQMRSYTPLYRTMSANFATLNRNKRSITLDLKSPEGRQVFRDLVKTADVVVEGFRPEVMQRLGLDYESLREIRPGLVYCSITGYGQTGPNRDRTGHDLNYLAYAGALGLSGNADGPPVAPSVLFGDIAGGAYPAALAIMISLRHRDRTGEGEYIDISMLDGIVSTMYAPVSELLMTGRAWQRGAELPTGGSPRYGIYRTSDGRYLSLCPLEEKFWQTLFQHLGLEPPDDSTPEACVAAKRLLAEILERRTLDEWMKELATVDICVAPVLTIDEAMSNPQITSRELVQKFDHPSQGQQYLMRNPIRTRNQSEAEVRKGAPELGEDTDAVLRELGYEEETISEFRVRGISR